MMAILFAILFFAGKQPAESLLTRRAALGCLIGAFPALLLYRSAAMIGYNPTGFRYYAGFELALGFIAATGVACFLQRLADRYHAPAVTDGRRRLNAAFAVTTAVSLIGGIAYATDGSLHFSGGSSVGIETPDGDMKRLRILTYAGRYCDTVFPKGWRIATTEMDTFGFMSGREVLDLWGYSNRSIATSTRRDGANLKINTHVLIDSDVEAYWLRSFDPSERNPAVRTIAEVPRSQVPSAVVCFPNTGPFLDQAGDLVAVFQKYDMVRIYQPRLITTVILVRKDLTPRLLARLHATGHEFLGATPFDMNLLRKVYGPYREACR
jgi:hypothetical protein